MLQDYRRAPLKGGQPKQVIIFLHGVGDSGQGGLLSIGDLWAPFLPDCEFLCPDAPFPFDMGPPGFQGRQWFSLQNFTPKALEEGARQAEPLLNSYIDNVLQSRNLSSDSLALVGFSQGTMMALFTAPRREKPVAFVVGYSGMLLGGESLATEKRCSPPVLLVHGTHDNVVPFSALAEAERGLKAASIPTRVLATSTEHTIDNVGLTEGIRMIKSQWSN